MKKVIKGIVLLMCITAVLVGMTTTGFAHSGRTDGSGGHRDNKNVSGLGSYHYHCGGYPAHLHVSGYCPYRDVFPKSVSVKSEKTSLALGEEVSVAATVSPTNACSSSVSWESSAPGVVRVHKGKITAVGFGTATVTASTFNEKKGSIEITVREVVADSIAITGFSKAEEGGENILYIGDKKKLGAELLPENVDNPTVTWESSNPEVVSVEDGKIEAQQAGTATITAVSSNGRTDTLTLTVKEIVAERIEITAPDIVTIGDEARLNVRYYPSNTSYKDIEWKTSDRSIAAIDGDGNLKAVSVGTATITAVQKDVEAKVTIEVRPIAVENIAFSAPSDFEGQFRAGESVQLTAAIYPEDATYKELAWSSSNPEVATVSENGLVSAISSGVTYITALSVDGAEMSIQLRVANQLIPAALAGIVVLVVLAITLIAARVLKKNRADWDDGAMLSEYTKKARKKELMSLGVIGVLIIAGVAVAAGVFSMFNKYERAVFLANSSRPMNAAALFKELGSFKDSEEQLARILAQDVSLGIQFSQVGDEIIYGHYEQDGNHENGDEPLKWVIIDMDEKSALLVSRYIIDARSYAEAADDPRTLDEWLDSDFITNAFSDCVISQIDDIGLLSLDDMSEYMEYVDNAEWTEYALDQKPHSKDGSGAMWWLNETCEFDQELFGSVVCESGSNAVDTLEAYKKAGVRPLMTVMLKED